MEREGEGELTTIHVPRCDWMIWSNGRKVLTDDWWIVSFCEKPIGRPEQRREHILVMIGY